MLNNIIQQFNTLYNGLKDDVNKKLYDLLRQIIQTHDNSINSLVSLEASDTQLLKLFAHVYKSTLTTVATGTGPTVSFDKIKYNYGNMFDATKADRITIPYKGVYQVTVGVLWDSNATGNRSCQLTKNGAGYKDQIIPACNGIQTGFCLSVTDLFQLGDYVSLATYQSSGGNLTITAVGDRSLYMTVQGLYLQK